MTTEGGKYGGKVINNPYEARKSRCEGGRALGRGRKSQVVGETKSELQQKYVKIQGRGKESKSKNWIMEEREAEDNVKQEAGRSDSEMSGMRQELYFAITYKEDIVLGTLQNTSSEKFGEYWTRKKI